MNSSKNNSVKRWISILLSALLLSSAALPLVAGAADRQTALDAVCALGIIAGDENGSLNLSKTVTRAEFAKMLVTASSLKDNVGDLAGVSPFKDVKSSHWAAATIKTAVDAGWLTGYVDGTYRPDEPVLLEEAASAALRLLGYSAGDYVGAYPSAQLSKYRSLKLSDGVTASQGSALTRDNCVYLFYNLMSAQCKSGEVYGKTLGYSLTSTGELDYSALLLAETKGPYVVTGGNWTTGLPFDSAQATVQRNGKASGIPAVTLYDVYYYNENTATLWVYSNRAVGLYTAAAPNQVSPTSVTVGGNTYTIGTSAAAQKLSANFAYGDTVALLLGMNGDVVDVLSAAEVDSAYSGVIESVSLITYGEGDSKTSYVLSIACADGVVRQWAVSSLNYEQGGLVSAGYRDGKPYVECLSTRSLSGTVSADGKRIGQMTLSDDAQILDVSSGGAWASIYPQRLAGTDLTNRTHYYETDRNGAISLLILDDITGDLHEYGVLTSVSENEMVSAAEVRLNGNYQYIQNGKVGVQTTTNTIYNVQTGAVKLLYKAGSIDSIQNLTLVSVSEIGPLTATGKDKSYRVAEQVQVYLKNGSSYEPTDLSAINGGDYRLSCYVDSGHPAGGLIRIVIAEKSILNY